MSINSITKLHKAYIDKEIKPSEFINDTLNKIESINPKLNAYLSVFKEEATKQALDLDQKIAKGKEIFLLEGIPISIKDAILVEGHKTTSSSKILEDYTAVYDATVIKKLKQKGAILMGKTNLDEFAMGSSTENSAFGPTLNPVDEERVPGGSSGGSAASVKASLCLASLGSDTGGSIRQPAALTGIVGLKPTYGRVSRFGLIAMASSLDQIGPFTNNVLDSAYMLEAIEGKDPMDATSIELSSEQKLDFDKIQNKSIKGMTIGLPKEYFIDGISPEIKEAVNDTIERYKSLGVNFKEISLPYSKYAIPTYYILMPAEVSTNLARFDGIRYGLSEFENSKDLKELYFDSRTKGFGKESMRRIMLGSYVLSSGYYDAYYSKAKKIQSLIKQDFDKAFLEVDAILTPTTPNTAFKLGEKTNDPLAMYLEDIFTVATNIAGIPGISIPTPTNSGLPIGFQLMTKHFDENTLLQIGYNIEKIS